MASGRNAHMLFDLLSLLNLLHGLLFDSNLSSRLLSWRHHFISRASRSVEGLLIRSVGCNGPARPFRAIGLP